MADRRVDHSIVDNPESSQTRPDVVGDRYVISELLGSGGTAKVYRAHDRLLHREVALKILREQYAEDAAFVERFLREAKSAAALDHRRVVGVYDQGRTGEGDHYTVMEYLSGGSLEDLLNAEDGPLPPRIAAEIAAQIAGALGAAHEAGLAHRDVKPQNVLLTGGGKEVKVADFGIARAVAATTISGAGTVLGTAAYMSPEQAGGEPVDGRSDLYSLGVVLYEMLTGERPYEADTPIGLAMKHIHSAPRHPREVDPGLPEGLDIVTAGLLAKGPAHRYQSATELAEDLERVLEGLPPVRTPAVPPARAGRGSRRRSLHRRLSVVSALLILLVLTVSLATVFGPPATFAGRELLPWESMEEFPSSSAQTPQREEKAAAEANGDPAGAETPRTEETHPAEQAPRREGGPAPSDRTPEGAIAEAAKAEGSDPRQTPVPSTDAEANADTHSAPGPTPIASGRTSTSSQESGGAGDYGVANTPPTPSARSGFGGSPVAGATTPPWAKPTASAQTPAAGTPPGSPQPLTPVVEPPPSAPPVASAEPTITTGKPAATQSPTIQQRPSGQSGNPAEPRTTAAGARQAPQTGPTVQEGPVVSEPAPPAPVPKDRRGSSSPQPSPTPPEQKQPSSPANPTIPEPVAPESPEIPEPTIPEPKTPGPVAPETPKQPAISEPVSPEPPEKPQSPTFRK